MKRRVWVLNLDAELELEGRGRGADPLAMARRRPEVVAWLRSSLVPSSDAIVSSRDERFDGSSGVAFSPTPAALAVMDAVGATRPVRVPSFTVLEHVATRGFSASLGLMLPGSVFARSLGEVEAVVRTAPGSAAWLLRRAFGLAGGGRRSMASGELTGPARSFVARALESGGVLVEPLVDRIADFALHGYVDGETFLVGEPTLSRVDGGGVWRGSERAAPGDLHAGERDALTEETRRAGLALARAGYSGPYGVDGFRYKWAGEERFSPRCEINARYSMGWAVGMGKARPDLDVAARG